MQKFRQFYIDNGDKLFGYLLRKSGNIHLAADLVQETFTRYLERYRHRECNPALLFTMGRNLFYDERRFAKRFVANDGPDVAGGTGQEENYIAQEESDKVFAAMAGLDDDERDILALVVSSDLSYQEIADMRQCSLANIKVKVHRARKKLKQLLQENDCG